MSDLKKYLLPFYKEAKPVSNKEVSGKDYFIYPGKAIVGDKKYFATVKDKSGYTYGADTDKAKLIKKEFTDKNLIVQPESTVYTDTTHVQSFRGKQQHVRHIVDGNIINKKTTTIKKDTPSVTTKPISKKDAQEIKDIRHEFAGEKQRGYIPPPPTFLDKVKSTVGGWFKGGENKAKLTYQSPTWLHDAGTAEAIRINKELGLKSGFNASAVADTARFDNNISRIFLSSVIPGHPDTKTRIKYLNTDTGKELSKVDNVVPSKALENVIQKRLEKGEVKTTKLKKKKKAWFRGT